MKNKKGFTLVEVLGVIVILAILAGLVITAVMRYFQEGKDDYNVKLSDQLLIAGKTFFSDNRQLLPTATSEKKYAFVTVPELQNGNYVAKEFTDSEGRECSPSYVFVMQKNYNSNDYEYIPCLICQNENGDKKDYSQDKEYCDPSLWENNVIPEEEPEEEEPEPPVPPTGEFTCVGTYKNGITTITKATSLFGIDNMYYTGEDGTDIDIALTTSEHGSKTITNKVLPTSVPKDADIFLTDLKNNTSGACDITNYEDFEPEDETPPEPGAPKCKFTNVPTGYYTSAKTLTAVCSNTEDKIKVVNTSKIVSHNKYGTLTVTPDKETGTKITFSIKYTPKSKMYGTDYVKIHENLVKNTSNNKTNNTTKAKVKVDTVDPVITFKVTKGKEEKATAIGDTRKGYKNSVTVQIKCTDKSGLKTFKVNKTSTNSPASLKLTKQGTNKITATCTDNAGHKVDAEKSYIVFKYSCNKSKCGSYTKKCTNYCCGCYGHYNYSCPSGYSRAGSVCRKNVRLGPYSSTAICLKSCNYHSITGRCYTTDSGAYVNNGKCPPSHPKCWLCDVYVTTSATSKWVCDSPKTCTKASCCGTGCNSCWY